MSYFYGLPVVPCSETGKLKNLHFADLQPQLVNTHARRHVSGLGRLERIRKANKLFAKVAYKDKQLENGIENDSPSPLYRSDRIQIFRSTYHF